MATAGVDEG